MAIYRTHKESGRFMILDKTSIKDTKLSLKAKGLLVTMLEKPDGWKFYESELVKSCKDGKDSVKAGIKELIDAGYLTRTRTRDDKGRLGNYDYDVYETPVHNGNSNIGKTDDGKTNVGKSAPINNNLSNNNLSNNNLSNNDLNDMNDIERENQDIHTDHTDHSNHLSDNKFDNSLEEKEIEVQNMPETLASYLMNYRLSEIKSIKSSLLKAKSSFYKEVEVEERMTIEDIEEHLIAALKRINVKSRKNNEPIEKLEAYMFKTFKTTFYTNIIWNDDDETVDGDPEILRAFFEDGIASGY
ncbi:hypothetical protein QNJ28_00530 [Macrococcus caseolyticus]|uniref:hypothetical protein n=1 Tax=Macrococcoides caseolyticum TaxID=69966 RepID=UPI0024BD5990|nr:hypothetical protein [Macrococcus caseolyticus]MDJ1108571.1 hypothetical protein [Macrococcus caseolyticus]